MTYSARFMDGQWYRVRVEPGGSFDMKGREDPKVLFSVPMLVTGGEMEGQTAPWETFITEKTKKSVVASFKVLDFDAAGTDLHVLETAQSPIVGKECWARCSIQEKQGGGHYPARFADIVELSARIPGGVAHKAAVILGNTATGAPSAEGYADNF